MISCLQSINAKKANITAIGSHIEYKTLVWLMLSIFILKL